MRPKKPPSDAVPHDTEAEKAALGSVIVNPALLPELTAITDAEWWHPGHDKIAAALRRLGKAKIDPDVVSLAAELGESLPDVGGRAYLESLVDAVPTSSHLPYYIRIVRETARDRRTMEALHVHFEAIRSRNGGGRETIDQAAGALREVLDQPIGAVPLEPLKWAGWTASPPPAAYQDGDEVLLCRGDLVMAAAEVGAGKSVACLDLVLAWSLGLEWLGMQHVGEGGPACYLSSDGDSEEVIRTRVARLAAGRDLKLDGIDAAPLSIVARTGLSLDDPEGWSAVRAWLDRTDPEILVLDSLRSLSRGRKLSDDSEVADFFSTRLRPLQERPRGSRRTLVIVHHLRKLQTGSGAKEANDSKQRVSQSERILGDCDHGLALESAMERTFVVRCIKPSRHGTNFRQRLVRIVGDPPGPLTLETTPMEQRSETRSADENRVLEALSIVDRDGTGASQADLRAAMGIPHADQTARRRVERALNRLVAGGRIVKEGTLYRDASGTDGTEPVQNV